ncbi:MAG: hypothetical protein IKY61_00810, partial [Thermoguttaceae bacterium]|nr:hypothetical protein [Thermoguttaceae bacterium]
MQNLKKWFAALVAALTSETSKRRCAAAVEKSRRFFKGWFAGIETIPTKSRYKAFGVICLLFVGYNVCCDEKPETYDGGREIASREKRDGGGERDANGFPFWFGGGTNVV